MPSSPAKPPLGATRAPRARPKKPAAVLARSKQLPIIQEESEHCPDSPERSRAQLHREGTEGLAGQPKPEKPGKFRSNRYLNKLKRQEFAKQRAAAETMLFDKDDSALALGAAAAVRAGLELQSQRRRSRSQRDLLQALEVLGLGGRQAARRGADEPR